MSEKPVDGVYLDARGDVYICPKGREKGTRLYAQSPAEARALAIAECAKVADAIRQLSIDNGSHWTAKGAELCEVSIRALSDAPTVSEEWVRYVATSGNLFDKKNSGVAFEAVRATLAALGVQIKDK